MLALKVFHHRKEHFFRDVELAIARVMVDASANHLHVARDFAFGKQELKHRCAKRLAHESHAASRPNYREGVSALFSRAAHPWALSNRPEARG
jgi:hypothetical protein